MSLFFTFASIQGMIDMFSDLRKAFNGLFFFFFGKHCLREVFQTLRDYNLARGLVIHTRFDDLDLISGS